MRNKETMRPARSLYQMSEQKVDSSQNETFVMYGASNLTDPGLQSTHSQV